VPSNGSAVEADRDGRADGRAIVITTTAPRTASASIAALSGTLGSFRRRTLVSANSRSGSAARDTRQEYGLLAVGSTTGTGGLSRKPAVARSLDTAPCAGQLCSR
jgi:hypothetical protein